MRIINMLLPVNFFKLTFSLTHLPLAVATKRLHTVDIVSIILCPIWTNL